MSLFGKGNLLLNALTRLYGEAAERDAILMRPGDTDCAIIDRNLERLGQIPAADVRVQNETMGLGSTGCAAYTELHAPAEKCRMRVD